MTRYKFSPERGTEHYGKTLEMNDLIGDVDQFDYIGCFASEPSSSTLKKNSFALYQDSGSLKIKAKDSSGTVITRLNDASLSKLAEVAAKTTIMNTY